MPRPPSSIFLRLSLIALFIGTGAVPLHGDDATAREYSVKAAMILNFMQFVEWPNKALGKPNQPLVIGVVGTNPFGDAMEKIAADKRISDHPLVVRYFASAEQIEACHVLFVPRSQDGNLSRILAKVVNQPVLSIGETDAFPWTGGIVRFYQEDNKVRFEINPDAADRNGLKVSSKLLKLARIFHR